MQWFWKFDTIHKNSILSYQHFEGAVKKRATRIHKHKTPNQTWSHKLSCVFPFPPQNMRPLDLTGSDNKEQPLIPGCLQWKGINCHKLFPFFFPHCLHTLSIFFQPEEQLHLLGAKADSRTANKGAGAQNLTEKASMAWGRHWLAALT